MYLSILNDQHLTQPFHSKYVEESFNDHQKKSDPLLSPFYDAITFEDDSDADTLDGNYSC